MKTDKPLISINRLRVGYNKTPLLESFSLDIFQKDFLSIVGSNGSGKTTLVRTLLGLHAPVSGQVKKSPETVFGYVPQRSPANMAFPLTVEQVVMLGRVKRMGPFRTPNSNDYHVVVQALEDVALKSKQEDLIHTLSGGQYQRMLIARALASEPNVLVLDEPTTGMDIVAEHDFMNLIKTLRETRELSIVAVTHDLVSAAQHSDSLVVINGQDRSVTVGPPLDVLTTKRLSNLFHRPLQVVKEGGRIMFMVGEAANAPQGEEV